MKKKKGVPGGIGRALKEARDAHGWTQEEAAAKTTLAVQVYGRLERNVGEPMASTIVKLARGLKVSSDKLLGLTDPPEVVRESAGSYDQASVAVARREIGKLLGALRSALKAAEAIKGALR